MPRTAEPDRLRRRKIMGILLVAALIFLFSMVRANWSAIFPTGWWRW